MLQAAVSVVFIQGYAYQENESAKTSLSCQLQAAQERPAVRGGVRPGGYCEVYPDRRCVWSQAWERSRKMRIWDGIHLLQPAVDWRLEGSSEWINMLTGADQPPEGENTTH